MNEQIYKFEYDVLNRINLATFGERTAGSLDFNNLYGASFENYDANGNIGKITRYGPTITEQSGNTIYGCKTLIDDLTLSYSGNQINTVADVVSDAVNRLRGFKANTSSVLAYGYDANGNLISDPHKGLVVSYNYLNLPEYFDFGSGDVIDILYDAEGRKLQKAVGGSMLAQKDYCQEFEYGDKALEAIYNNEGRVVRNGGNWEFQYALRDHLGSTRVLFKESVDELDIIQENHHYPFGGLLEGKWSEIQPAVNQDYKYNNKELNQEYNLDWMDFGNRWAMTWLPHFSGIDPISEQFAHVSTYNYAENSPIANIDLWGLQAFTVHGTKSDPQTFEDNPETLPILLEISGNKTINNEFSWPEGTNSFTNDEADRRQAAEALATHVLDNLSEDTNESITLIGHSHGGNVAIQAVDLIREGLGEDNTREINLITIATPAYNSIGDPENPGSTSVDNHTQFSSLNDGIQMSAANAAGSKTAARFYINSDNTTNVTVQDFTMGRDWLGRAKKSFNHGKVESHSIHSNDPNLLRQN